MSFNPIRPLAGRRLRVVPPAMAATAVILAVAFSALAGCGKQGPPLPPLRNVPAATKDLTVAQRGNRILLSFLYPKTTPGGAALTGVTSVEVWEVAQAAPSQGAPPALDPRQFAGLAKKGIALNEADIRQATVGDRVVIDLPVPDPLPQPAMATHFAVKTAGPTGDLSEYSNQVPLVVKTPAAAPEEVAATAEAGGIRLSWKPVAGVLGYSVYRRNAEQRIQGRPLALLPGADTVSYVDTTAQFGQSYIYAVTAVSEREPFIESVVQREQEVRYVDRFPPTSPSELVALAEVARVRLVWKAAETADLAGYNVYRRAADATSFEKITAQPLPNPEFADGSVASGRVYIYRVTAVDTTGNESAPSGPAQASVP